MSPTSTASTPSPGLNHLCPHASWPSSPPPQIPNLSALSTLLPPILPPPSLQSSQSYETQYLHKLVNDQLAVQHTEQHRSMDHNKSATIISQFTRAISNISQPELESNSTITKTELHDTFFDPQSHNKYYPFFSLYQTVAMRIKFSNLCSGQPQLYFFSVCFYWNLAVPAC